MNNELREKVVAELMANPARAAVAAERLGVSRDVVYWYARKDPRIGIIGRQPMSKGRPIPVYGPAGATYECAPQPKKDGPPKKSHKARWPRRICPATETAAVVARDVKRMFGKINRTKPLTAYVRRDVVYVTTPEKYEGDPNNCIGTYVPSATKRDIYEDYAHHLEGRAAA